MTGRKGPRSGSLHSDLGAPRASGPDNETLGCGAPLQSLGASTHTDDAPRQDQCPNPTFTNHSGLRPLLFIIPLVFVSCESFERAGERLTDAKEEIRFEVVEQVKDLIANPTIANAAMNLAELIAYIGSVAFGVGGTAVMLRNKRSNARKTEIEHRLEVVEAAIEDPPKAASPAAGGA
jgi:hypothetical protein